jgi:hypothetical protein
MLPDFATMLGTRPPRVEGDDLTEGVAFHHQTDRVFHDAPTFKRLQLSARRMLREMGLPRPSALAVGHIGVEILLDGKLAEDERAVAAYLDALSLAHTSEVSCRIEWSDEPLRESFAALASMLLDRGVTPATRTAERSAFRVTRALASRPRLRLTDAGADIVRKWSALSEPVVAAAADDLITELRRGLSITRA